jgi:hypothetical protein
MAFPLVNQFGNLVNALDGFEDGCMIGDFAGHKVFSSRPKIAARSAASGAACSLDSGKPALRLAHSFYTIIREEINRFVGRRLPDK